MALKEVLADNTWLHYAAAAVGAAFVVGVGKFLQNRHTTIAPAESN